MAIVFTQAANSKRQWSLNFAGLFLSELKNYSTKCTQLKQRHINCTWMLTRIAYFAVGMVDELPPALPHSYWISQSQLPAATKVTGKKEAAPSPRTVRHREKKREQEVPSQSSSDMLPDHSSSSSDSSEKTETDREQSEAEQEHQSHPEEKEIPAVSQQWQRWAHTLDEEGRRKKELRTKKGRDPSAQRSVDPQAEKEKLRMERQKEIEERVSLAERHRQYLAEKLKRKAEEDTAQGPATKRPRVEEVDVPPIAQPQATSQPIPLSPPVSPPPSAPLPHPESPPLIIPLSPLTPPSSPPQPSSPPHTAPASPPPTSSLLTSEPLSAPPTTTVEFTEATVTSSPIIPPLPSTTTIPPFIFDIPISTSPSTEPLPAPYTATTAQSPLETPTSEPLTFFPTVPVIESVTQAHTSTVESTTSPHTDSITAPALTTSHAPPLFTLAQLVTPIPVKLTTEVTHVTLTTDTLISRDEATRAQEPFKPEEHMGEEAGPSTTDTINAAKMAKYYISCMEEEQQKLKQDQSQLEKEIGTLQEENEAIVKAWEEERNSIKELKVKLNMEKQRYLQEQQALESERTKTFALEMKVLDQEQLIARMAKDHEDHLERMKWAYTADLDRKDIELKAVQKAQSLTLRRLKQAERDIDDYMANPLVDPTTRSGKDELITKLDQQIKTNQKINDSLWKNLTEDMSAKEEECENLKAELKRLEYELKSKSSPLKLHAAPLQADPLQTLQPPPVISLPQASHQAGTSHMQYEAPPEDTTYTEDPIPEDDFYDRIDKEKDEVIKECMRWEKRILESACIAYLKPEAARQDYHQPTLPYPLLKQDCILKKAQMLPELTTNAMGTYDGVAMTEAQVAEIQDKQPAWRASWMERNAQFKFHYLRAPQELRIDPTFCPLQRRRSWDTFKRLTTTDRQNWLNYPVLLPPQEGRAPTETYMLSTFSKIIREFSNIPDIACVMLIKIVRMLQMLINAFNDMSQAGTHWTTYFEGPTGLAWNLQGAPSKEILMGLYSRCIFLPSHYMVTFEEAFYTGFFEIESKIFSMMNQDPRSRYVAFMKMEMDRPFKDVVAEAEQQQRIKRFQKALRDT